MTSPKTLSEFRAAWLPHISDGGLTRLADMLERGSPQTGCGVRRPKSHWRFTADRTPYGARSGQ